MKHYDFATDQMVDVSVFYKLYWHFHHKKFFVKAWLLRKLVLLFGEGTLAELLSRPNDGVASIDNFYTARGVAYAWFNGVRQGK